MAWLEKRADRYRINYRFGGQKQQVSLRIKDAKEAGHAYIASKRTCVSSSEAGWRSRWGRTSASSYSPTASSTTGR